MTVRQPWAWALIRGGKDVENRSRNIAGAYRGPVAIHAGLSDAETAPEALWLRSAEFYRERRDLPLGKFSWRDTDRGSIIGVADLVDVHAASDCWERDLHRLAGLPRQEREAHPDNGAGGLIGRARMCSAWGEDEVWHLRFESPRPLSSPIRFTGGLGLRRLDAEVEAAVIADLALTPIR